MKINLNIGDSVYASGFVDGKWLDESIPDEISDISSDKVTTNMDENGVTKIYTYDGILYYLKKNNWWVTPYNLKKEKIKRVYSFIDPYGEEIQEAIKIKEELVLYNLEGIPFEEVPIYTINGLLQKYNREDISKMLRKLVGKKIHFNNLKDKSIKKDRIFDGDVLWQHNDVTKRIDLLIQGTKKWYKVDPNRPIGYYDVRKKKIYSPIDPYGEEIWEGVRWYNKGRFIESNDEPNLKFEVDDRVSSINAFYWSDKDLNRSVERVGNVNHGAWAAVNYINGTVTQVYYCNTPWYRGELITLKGRWPWFQADYFNLKQ